LTKSGITGISSQKVVGGLFPEENLRTLRVSVLNIRLLLPTQGRLIRHIWHIIDIYDTNSTEQSAQQEYQPG